MENKNMVFLSVIAVATLLTAVVGATFAYFSAGIGGDPVTNTVTTAKLASAQFTGAANVEIEEGGIYPGWIGLQTFTISVTSSDPTQVGKYSLELDATVDSAFTGNSSIKYTIYRTTDTVNNNFTVEKGQLVATNGQYYKEDTLISGTNADMDTVVETGFLTTTSGNKFATVDFKGGDATVTYYIVYEFANSSNDQSAAMGKTFATTVRAVPESLESSN